MSEQKRDPSDDTISEPPETTERRPDEPEATDDAGFGFGESDIPDPMPEELRDVPDQTKVVEPMEGESPTG